jgi:hypothetical protein
MNTGIFEKKRLIWLIGRKKVRNLGGCVFIFFSFLFPSPFTPLRLFLGSPPLASVLCPPSSLYISGPALASGVED